MTTDLGLAIAHHVLIFLLAGVIAAELALVRRGIDARGIRLVASIDRSYGVLAVLILAVGFARVYWGVKGPAAYLPNPYFWAKIGAFAVVGLLSIAPTIRFIGWARALRKAGQFQPSEADVTLVRRLVLAQVGVGLLIPVFAAVMARGYGLG